MKKVNWFLMGMLACIVVLVCMAAKAPGDRNLTILTTLVDHTARIIDLERKEPYDPNAPELSFLEPADPNWIRDFGDNERTKLIHQISKNRVMILRDEQIISEIAKRLLAIEKVLDPAPLIEFEKELKAMVDPNGPNEVRE